jgi:cellulose synthase/poly-beta-1,6-N-acetylglucosamine synthase-like glycosyltransferase
VKEFSRKEKRIKHIIEEDRTGKCSAVNLILKQAKSKDILVMLSADNLPERGSILSIIQPILNDEAVGCVSGHPVPVNSKKTFFGWIAHLLWGLHHVISLKEDVKLTGEFFAMNPTLIDKIPIVINDDLYIEYAIKRRGYSIKQASDAISYMKGPETLRDFLIQRVRVHVGHLQIAHDTGYVPKTASIIQIIKKMNEFFEFKKLHFLIAAFLLEMISRILAFYLFYCKKIPVKWEFAESTKEVRSSFS